MKILELVEQQNIELKKATSDEFYGPCPFCNGGTDRFRVFLDTDRYWCRQCDAKGDSIQFLIDTGNMSYNEARAIVEGKTHSLPDRPKLKAPPKPEIPSPKWRSMAAKSVKYWHNQLMKRPKILNWLHSERGIDRHTVEAWQLGFNPKYTKSEAEKWGDTGAPLGIPQGLVIPVRQADGMLTGIRIRQFKTTDAIRGRIGPNQNAYKSIRGSKFKMGWPLADSVLIEPVIIVESELDALLLWQELAMYATPIATHSAKAKPKLQLTKRPIFAMDFDKTGKESYEYWHSKYGALTLAPIRGKDITDMYKALRQDNLSLIDWLEAGLEDLGLITPEYLNPFAHFSLLAGSDWLHSDGIQAHVYQTCTDVYQSPVTQWQQAYGNSAAMAAATGAYRDLFKREA